MPPNSMIFYYQKRNAAVAVNCFMTADFMSVRIAIVFIAPVVSDILLHRADVLTV